MKVKLPDPESIPSKRTEEGPTPTQIQLAENRRERFLQVLAETGNVTNAAKIAGYAGTSALRRARKNSKEFDEQWKLALEAAGDILKDEAWRRAHDGVQEPNYYKGQVVGHTTKYSDSLLMFLIKAIDPSYRDNSRGGDVSVNFGVAMMPMQAQDEDSWEKRAVEMHDDQRIITVEEGSEDDDTTTGTMKRGD